MGVTLLGYKLGQNGSAWQNRSAGQNRSARQNCSAQVCTIYNYVYIIYIIYMGVTLLGYKLGQNHSLSINSIDNDWPQASVQ